MIWAYNWILLCIHFSILFAFGCNRENQGQNEIQIIDRTIVEVLDSVLVNKYDGKLIIADSTNSPMLGNVNEIRVEIQDMPNLGKLFQLESWYDWVSKNKPTNQWNGLLSFSRIIFEDDAGKYYFTLKKKGDSGIEGVIWLKRYHDTFMLDRFIIHAQL